MARIQPVESRRQFQDSGTVGGGAEEHGHGAEHDLDDGPVARRTPGVPRLQSWSVEGIASRCVAAGDFACGQRGESVQLLPVGPQPCSEARLASARPIS